jgi:hypothetical protein
MKYTKGVFPTHVDCANFSSGYCSLHRTTVDPDAPACPNFIPKGIMTAPQKARTYSGLPGSRVQSLWPYMPPYLPQPEYNIPSMYFHHAQTQHGYYNQYISPQDPSVITSASNRFTLLSSRGAGRGGGGRGRMGGFAAGPSGSCRCPKCGYTMPHTRGLPCYQQTCPKCGSMMTRGD